MRFVSRYPGYTFNYRNEFAQYLPDGSGATVKNVVRTAIDLKFSARVSLYPWEVEIGLKHFKFDGGLMEEDGVTRITPIYRLSVLDTNEVANHLHLSGAEKEEMEQKLLEDQFYGSDFIMIEEPRVPTPWPAYDTIKTAAKLVEQIAELGFSKTEDLERIVAYERQNLNRPEVLEAISSLNVPDEVLVSA